MPEKKQLKIYLTPEQIKKLKLIAVMEDTSVTALMEQATSEIISAHEKKKK